MAVLKMATAKAGDLSLLDSVFMSSVEMTVSDVDYRTPDYGLSTGRSFRVLHTGFSPYGYGTLFMPTTIGEAYVRIAFKANTYSSSDLVFFQFGEGSTTHVLISVNPALGNVRTYRGSTNTTLATSSSGVWAPYSWVCLEAYVKIADSGGRTVVRINGNSTPVIDYTGDTRNSGTGFFDSIRVGSYSGGGTGIELFFDDIMVRDDTWCGTGGIYLLTPNAAGDESDWSASQGEAWECVDELPPSFNDYISTPAANSGAISLFGVQNLPVAPTEITAVGVLAKARMSAPGSGLVRVAAKSGTTTVYGSSVGLDVGESWLTAFMDVDPNTSAAWTESGVNALQIGIENV